MKNYKDLLGQTYEVPDHCVEEFERERGWMLRIKIAIQAIVLGLLLWLAFV